MTSSYVLYSDCATSQIPFELTVAEDRMVVEARATTGAADEAKRVFYLCSGLRFEDFEIDPEIAQEVRERVSALLKEGTIPMILEAEEGTYLVMPDAGCDPRVFAISCEHLTEIPAITLY